MLTIISGLAYWDFPRAAKIMTIALTLVTNIIIQNYCNETDRRTDKISV